jgi:hypothetical protein
MRDRLTAKQRARGVIDVVEIAAEDLEDLRSAKRILLSPSFTAQLNELLGRPIEAGLRKLPKNWNEKLAEATNAALFKGLEFSVVNMTTDETRRSRDWLHKAIVTGSGVAAGAVGFYSLIVELPFSTMVMLRSIADVARSEGHDVSLVETRLACLEVFALGGGGTSSDSAEGGYWAVRAALAAALSDAGRYIAVKGLTNKGAPPLVRLIGALAARFGSVVTAQAAAIAVPVVGAVSGGAVNYLFMNHFQDLARAHFVIMRLEKKYGTEAVREVYEDLTV